MIKLLLAFAALIQSDVAQTTTREVAPATASAAQNSKVDRFAGRPQARITFSRDVRNFQVKRDGNDDVLFLETRRDVWFRSEIRCFGINDPRDALGLLPLDTTFGFDRFSRVALVGFGHSRTECQLDGLVELTPEESIELRLVRPRRAPRTTAPPPS